MLEELRIHGLGVIEEAALDFGPGLTVVSGETGAGKTMVVTGLQLLFGARADSARVRSGTDQLAVEGRVSAPPNVVRRVRDAGGVADEESDGGSSLVLRRTVTATGRSRAHAGGVSVPVGLLAEIGDDLLAIHGQAGQLRLARPAEQRATVDRYAGVDLSAYRAAWQQWQEAEQLWQQRLRDAASLTAESEILAHGLAEIEAVDPQPGEDDELTAISSRLAHVDALRLAARVGHDILVGAAEDPIAETSDARSVLVPALTELANVADADPQLGDFAARLGSISAQITDLAADLAGYEAGLDADPQALARVEDRRAELAALVRRYGRSADPTGPSGVAAVLHWAKQAAARHAEIDVSDEALTALSTRSAAARAAAGEEAQRVSTLRRAAAGRLSVAVTAELAGLAMAGSEFSVTVRSRSVADGQPSLELADGPAAAGSDGADEVAFELRADPAAPFLTLQRGASGGELARVMLALEVVLADSDPVPTMVFDEVDAGVGGRAAVEVGRRLARLARNRQVIVVTHLAQVAAFADVHLVVDKAVEKVVDRVGGRSLDDGAADDGGLTSSSVRAVAAADREVELSRMLAGSDTTAARRHAAELLAQARAHGG